ncbi:unnamed protein product, partial [Mesorhabditis belari]|uniref:Cytochrome P450 n=1 Tax=Mesorhabditis belari TaxID=2138241 RepID=A0AAF3EA21_9BILA
MGVQEVLLYFFWNFVGFQFFLFVWNRLPKPKPIDYTTIPGLKLECSAEELPPLSIPPPQSLSTIHKEKGHLSEISKTESIREFLEFSHQLFGPISSFYWGPRYVVIVSSKKILADLRNARENLVCANPYLPGSVLFGDSRFSSIFPLNSVYIEKTMNGEWKNEFSEEFQNHIFQRGPFLDGEMMTNEMRENPRDIIQSLQLVFKILQKEIQESETLIDALCRPLVCLYEKEIDVDAHPVPAWVPILLHPMQILDRNSATLLDDFHEEFNFLPGCSFNDQQLIELKKTLKALRK